MAYRLACDLADRITAVVAFAGADPGDGQSCQPCRPVSRPHVHGRSDSAVPYVGGRFAAVFPGRSRPWPTGRARRLRDQDG